MRSQLVYAAGLKMQNRFLLATVTMRAVRKLHIMSTRTQDTANRVLTDLGEGRAVDATLPTLEPATVMEPLLTPIAI